jgi:hypothetical protein
MKQIAKQLQTLLVLWLLPFAAFGQQHATLRATDYGQWTAHLMSNVAGSATSVTVAPCLFQPAGGSDTCA